MKNLDRDRFDGRLKSASEAKRQQLARFKAAADDPAIQAKRAEKLAVAEAREARREAKAIRLAQENEEQKRKEAEAAEAELAREAERKAERDRRYAARRNRNR